MHIELIDNHDKIVASFFELNDFADYLHKSEKEARLVIYKANHGDERYCNVGGKRLYVNIVKDSSQRTKRNCQRRRKVERCRDCLHHNKCELESEE